MHIDGKTYLTDAEIRHMTISARLKNQYFYYKKLNDARNSKFSWFNDKYKAIGHTEKQNKAFWQEHNLTKRKNYLHTKAFKKLSKQKKQAYFDMLSQIEQEHYIQRTFVKKYDEIQFHPTTNSELLSKLKERLYAQYGSAMFDNANFDEKADKPKSTDFYLPPIKTNQALTPKMTLPSGGTAKVASTYKQAYQNAVKRQDARNMTTDNFLKKYGKTEWNVRYHLSANEVNAKQVLKLNSVSKKAKQEAQARLDRAKQQDRLDKQLLSHKPSSTGLPLGKASAGGGGSYGCKALLCFAGGMHVAECRSTIRKVLRDMWKGRGFPTCIGYNGRVNAGISRIAFKKSESYQINGAVYCPDKKTFATRVSFRRNEDDEDIVYACDKVEINIPKDIAADKQHQKQIYYFNRYR